MLIALTVGFRAVVLAGAACYVIALALAMLIRQDRPENARLPV